MFPAFYVYCTISGSCRCVIIGVPWCLRRLSPFSTFMNMFLTNKSPQAKHAETDPRHGTPTAAHFQPPGDTLQHSKYSLYIDDKSMVQR